MNGAQTGCRDIVYVQQQPAQRTPAPGLTAQNRMCVSRRCAYLDARMAGPTNVPADALDMLASVPVLEACVAGVAADVLAVPAGVSCRASCARGGARPGWCGRQCCCRTAATGRRAATTLLGAGPVQCEAAP